MLKTREQWGGWFPMFLCTMSAILSWNLFKGISGKSVIRATIASKTF